MISPMSPSPPILATSYIFAPRQPEATTSGPATRMILASLIVSLSSEQRVGARGLDSHLPHHPRDPVGQIPIIGEPNDHMKEHLSDPFSLFSPDIQPFLVDEAESAIPLGDPGQDALGLCGLPGRKGPDAEGPEAKDEIRIADDRHPVEARHRSRLSFLSAPLQERRLSSPPREAGRGRALSFSPGRRQRRVPARR